jgi:hypothetical protein
MYKKLNEYKQNKQPQMKNMYKTYGNRFMNEIIATNESEWAEHMYVVFACYVLFMLLCIIGFRVLD